MEQSIKPKISEISSEDELILFASKQGREKRMYLHTKEDEKFVLQEYKKNIPEPVLEATVLQQQILKLLMPDRFVVDIHDSGFVDGIATMLTSFVEIDETLSPNQSESSKLIYHTKQIKDSDHFKNMVPNLKKIGLIPNNEPEDGQLYTNEQAANTVYDMEGSQIVVDIQSPIIETHDKKRPALLKQGVLEIAKSKGLGDEIDYLFEKYEEAFQRIDLGS